MSAKYFSPIASLILSIGFISTPTQAEHTGDPPLTQSHPATPAPHHDVKMIFDKKCSSCHDGDEKFGADGLPSLEFKQKALDSIRKKPGVKPMPPQSQEQLTEQEINQIDAWANDGEKSEPLSEFCSRAPQKNTRIVTGIASDRCVACHGKLSFNPTSLLRKSHTQFLTNDGKLDETVLGDMSEVPGYSIPLGKTSLGRILDSLTNYMMPPRGNLPVLNRPSGNMLPELGTPHMTDAERKFFINALNERKKRESCPITESKWGTDEKSSKPLSYNYSNAAKFCSEQGMRIPTRTQLLSLQNNIFIGTDQAFCVWTSTFGSNLQGDTKTPLRKVLIKASEVALNEGLKEEKAKCRVLCVK